jgi:hypothetical protein
VFGLVKAAGFDGVEARILFESLAAGEWRRNRIERATEAIQLKQPDLIWIVDYRGLSRRPVSRPVFHRPLVLYSRAFQVVRNFQPAVAGRDANIDVTDLKWESAMVAIARDWARDRMRD